MQMWAPSIQHFVREFRLLPQQGEAPGRAILRDLDLAETLAAVQEQVEGLTFGILDVRIDELPLRLQRHTAGVPRRWSRLLRMIAQAVACYHEHH